MKKVMLISALIVICFWSKAQSPTFNEWLRQKKTQRKYLVEQIGALQVYFEYLKKGYNIVDKGLTNIGNIKNATHQLDNNYFSSLKQVSPVITSSPKYRETTRSYEMILNDLQLLSNDVQGDANFSAKEKAYVEAIYQKMRSDCNATMEAFLMAVSPEVAEMQDSERLSRLDKVHSEMKDRLSFTKHFVSSTRVLSLQRAKEKHSIQVMRKINGQG